MTPHTQVSNHPLLRSIFILSCILFVAGQVLATTVSGTSRQVTIDGNVASANGAIPGTNGSSWETDEVFQGFQSIINWYATWDDDNLYLGKVGGNNSQGAIIYLRAEYPGATFTNTPQQYDKLQPDLTAMGGVNFGAFMKIGYNEFRTWGGSNWSSASSGNLFPVFLPDLEVVIPWDSITQGNGKPLNIRFVLYQVDSLSTNCTPNGPFVYAESPWGTGIAGNGPNIGVNDGVPTSLVQPGGCGIATAAATRWWGCYPVIGGVSSNGWNAVSPDAGPDFGICEDSIAILGGNTPPAIATGTWSVLGVPSGAPPPIFSSINDPNPIITNLVGYGPYIFEWSIDYNSCPAEPDTLVMTRFMNPPAANAGADQALNCGTITVNLSGNDPGPQLNGLGGSGTWAQITGTGQISNISTFSTTVNNLSQGLNQFVWLISNGPCSPSQDTVNIIVPFIPNADAGPDTGSCEVPLFGLMANNPGMFGPTAQGTWNQLSGPSNLIFSNANSFSSNISNISTGSFVLTWTVTNPGCPSSVDTIIYTNYSSPSANAGPDTSYCLGTSGIEIVGNDPLTSVQNSATGLWSQISGPSSSSLQNPGNYISIIQNLEAGVYTYQWTVQNGICPSDSDVVSISMIQVLENGLAQLNNSTTSAGNGSVTIAQPSGGIPPYTFSLEGGAFGISPDFTDLVSGNYLAVLMDQNGCLDSLSFFIDRDSIPKELFIASGFSPNGDLINDTWEIPGINLFPEAEISIFNIWGGIIYESKGKYNPWDGRKNGSLMPIGTYYFLINLNDVDNQQFKGNVTIFR